MHHSFVRSTSPFPASASEAIATYIWPSLRSTLLLHAQIHHHRSPADTITATTSVFLTFLFVFAGVGSAKATGKTIPLAGGADSVVGQTAVALAHTLVVAVMVSAGLHVSGGHFNPAVTLGLAVTGRITLFRSALYIVAQLLGSALACLLLTFLTAGHI